MCGIFGIITKHGTVDPLSFASLGQANTIRGNRGFGGIVIANGSLSTYRYPQPFDEQKVELEGVQTALGHVRAPTGGQSDRLDEIHPFETSDLLLAHNGI